ncbi:MAG: hypothetical protein IJ663_00020 [Spirochaetales bacterium]|nr:hypothetical protein [Spirochaetales bacterium]
MKKTFLFALIFALLFSMVACKSTAVEEEPVIEAVEVAPVEEEPAAEEPVVEEPVEEPISYDIDIKGLDGANIPGVLYQLQEGEPVIRGLALAGNQTSNAGGIEPAAENISFIFNLNEWIYIYPDTDKTEGISIRVAKHADDFSVYTKSFIEEGEFLYYADLYKPEDPNFEWGSFYVYQEEDPGFYDLIFINSEDNTPLAVIVIDLFKEQELSKYSLEQLQQIMADIIAASTK